MRDILMVLGVLLVAAPASAEYRKTPAGRFDISELHSEFKAAGVNLEGASCRREWNDVICEKMVGDFTDAEKATMDAKVVAHDPDIKAKRQAKRNADRASGNTKLKVLGLTDDELVAR